MYWLEDELLFYAREETRNGVEILRRHTPAHAVATVQFVLSVPVKSLEPGRELVQ